MDDKRREESMLAFLRESMEMAVAEKPILMTEKQAEAYMSAEEAVKRERTRIIALAEGMKATCEKPHTNIRGCSARKHNRALDDLIAALKEEPPTNQGERATL